jgi:hypothetical protein
MWAVSTEHSVTILKNCREAISGDGKLLLVERVMPAQLQGRCRAPGQLGNRGR